MTLALSAARAVVDAQRNLAKTLHQCKVRLSLEVATQADAEPEGCGTSCLLGALSDCLDSKRRPLNEQERQATPGSVPYYGATGQVGSVGDYLFDEPLLLIAEDGGPFDEFLTKHIAYEISGRSWVNNHAHVLRAAPASLHEWLLVNLEHRDVRAFVSGSTRGKLTKGQLERIPIWMPTEARRAQVARAYRMLELGRRAAEARAAAATTMAIQILGSLAHGE